MTKPLTPTSIRVTEKLLKDLTKAAHRMEMSRTQYIQQALEAAVAKTLKSEGRS